MKKIIFIFALMLSTANVFAAGEHRVATSQAYVTEELDTRQDKFNKLGADTAMTYSGATNGAIGSRTISGNLGTETNTSDSAIPTVSAVNTKLANQQDELDFAADTVLMNTGTAGTPAAKGIYDDTASYAAQQDALIDAATLNAAVQNAINSEFVCVERKIPGDDTSPCYLFEIATPVAPSRNLFDIAHSKIAKYGTLQPDGAWLVPNASFISAWAQTNIVPFAGEPNTQYTLSAEIKSDNVGAYSQATPGIALVLKYSDGTLKPSRRGAYTEYEKVRVMSDSGKTVVGFGAYYNTNENIYIKNLQIEEGTTATPYQPYGQNTFIPQHQQ